MIEFKFFPPKCAVCPQRTTAVDLIRDLEKEKAIDLGAARVVMEFSSGHDFPGTAELGMEIGTNIDEYDQRIEEAQANAVECTETCPGTLVIPVRDEKDGYLRVVRRCMTDKPNRNMILVDDINMFKEGGALQYTGVKIDPQAAVPSGVIFQR